jgi:hypothetical protein
VRLAIAADGRAAALAGLDGTFPWGEATTGSPPANADVTVELVRHPTGIRIVPAGGEPLPTRAPWPARDELFELQPPSEPRALVVGGDDEVRASVVARLEARGLAAGGAELLDAAALGGASVVALLGDEGEALPAEAPAVLAARRVLIAPRRAVTFGLLPGTDHLAFGSDYEVVQYADAVLTFSESFDVFRTLGAVTAGHHRASVVYGRIAADLR